MDGGLRWDQRGGQALHVYAFVRVCRSAHPFVNKWLIFLFIEILMAKRELLRRRRISSVSFSCKSEKFWVSLYGTTLHLSNFSKKESLQVRAPPLSLDYNPLVMKIGVVKKNMLPKKLVIFLKSPT